MRSRDGAYVPKTWPWNTTMLRSERVAGTTENNSDRRQEEERLTLNVKTVRARIVRRLRCADRPRAILGARSSTGHGLRSDNIPSRHRGKRWLIETEGGTKREGSVGVDRGRTFCPVGTVCYYIDALSCERVLRLPSVVFCTWSRGARCLRGEPRPGEVARLAFGASAAEC